MQEVERVWLGLTTPPLPVRMAEAGWAPDAVAVYCPRCGASVGRHDADDTGCSRCRGGTFPWERMIRLGEFDGLLREMVHEVKFTRWRRLGDGLGVLLGRAVGEIAAGDGVNPAQLVFVPVPSSFRRRMARGIDHARVIARGAARELGCDLINALQRRHGPSQTSLPQSRRKANMAGAFRCRSGAAAALAGRTVVLLDDVTTTRATLRAASRELRQGLRSGRAIADAVPTRIWAAVLAVTPEPGAKLPSSRGLRGEGEGSAGVAGALRS